MNDEALIAALTSFLAVIVYGYIAGRLAVRPVSESTKLTSLQFAIFWGGLAAASGLGGILSLVAVFQLPPLTLVISFLTLDVLAALAALWGLVCYLVFLYTGKRYLVPLTLLYVVEFGLLLYYYSASGASGVSVTLGSVNPTYSTPVGGAFLIIPVIVLIVPEFVAAFAYLSLYFRTKDPTGRYRIAMVSLSIFAWFGFGIFLGPGAFGGGATGLLVSRLIGILPALFILLAYFPPESVRRRFGIGGLGTAPAPASA